MGNNVGRIKPEFLPNKEAIEEFRKNDIATTSLLTRYSTLFTVLTVLFFILLIGLLGMIIYLLIEVYNDFTKHQRSERIIAIVIPCVMSVLLILYGIYYFKYVRQELAAADKIVTDIERQVTAPMTAASLKANLTNLVAIKTGNTDSDSVQRIYNNLDKQIGNGLLFNNSQKQQQYNQDRRQPPQYKTEYVNPVYETSF